MIEKITDNQRIKGYGLERPSTEYAKASLSRFLGNDKAAGLWAKASAECGVDGNTTDLNELEQLFRFLSKESGAIGVLGRSLVIRTVSYRTLSNKHDEHAE